MDIIEINKDYEIKGEDYEIKIHPIDKINNANSTYVDFTECEKILRTKYYLPDDEILTILQIEIDSKNKNSLINKLEYAVYNENKTRLDLSYCNNVVIKVNYGIKNSSLLNTSLISAFLNEGVDILDIEDDFFNDICYPYSDNETNTDMVLKDRVNDIYQNYTLCENNCKYIEYNLSSNSIICNCGIKTNITTVEENPNLGEMIKNTFKSSSFAVINCYKLIFSSKGISNNIGFWIFILLTICHIPLLIFYFCFEKNYTKLFIFKEMNKNNLLMKLFDPIKKNKHTTIEDKKNSTLAQEKNIKSQCIQINDNNGCKNKKKYDEINVYKNKQEKKNNIDQNFAYTIEKFKKKKKEKKKYLIKKRKQHSTEFSDEQPIDSMLQIKGKQANMNIGNRNNTRIYFKKILKIKQNKIEEQNFPGYYNLMLVNANNIKFKKPAESKFILTNYNFKQAIKYEFRGTWQIFFICLLFRQNILHTFFFKTKLELLSLRLCLFIFSFSCEFAFNALFYFNDNISARYNYEGDNLILFSFVNNIIITKCPTLGSFILRLILKYLTNSKKNIEKIFREEENKMRTRQSIIISEKEKEALMQKISKILQKLNYKILIFIILEFCLMLFFTYYVTAFCAVYKSTQTSWILDSFTSFLMTNFLDVLIAFIVAVIYTTSIKYKLESLYNISIFIYDLGH